MKPAQSSASQQSLATKRRGKFLCFTLAAVMLVTSMNGNLECKGDLDSYRANEKSKHDAAARDKTIITLVPNN
ncbi:MAG TPA: hypothetical protein PKW15_07125 [Alphaproteobacteria bacterium]|nr:hypothetical protein [Rhodospirillaceae bacterium]HRJ12996.1 hypothetical protein [Alphaproteobacteria bacterium]